MVDGNKKKVMELRIQRTLEALRKNNFPAVYAPTGEDAVREVEALLKEGDTISCGGSVTLGESGVRALMESGKYRFIDRANMDPEEAYLKTFSADVFLMSANAVTEKGQLYNVDGNGNRVAAMIYGPKRVIVVAGYNKLVADVNEAIARVKTTAAPANGVRLKVKTPCAATGICQGACGDMTAGCSSESRMCCQYVVTGYQRQPRIHVILVGEEMGY